MRNDLIEEIGVELLKRGYTVKYLKASFDVLARKNSQILLIKALSDANAIEQVNADEMKRISALIRAAPAIVAEKAGSALDDNVVYSRFGVYTLNMATFRNALDNRMPFVKRNKAGLTAVIVGQKLKEKREEKGYSLIRLSRSLGVSRSMIVKYETEKSEISINKALLLHKALGDKIFDRIDVLSSPEEETECGQGILMQKYNSLGFRAAEARNSPFDIIAKKDGEIVLTDIDREKPEFRSLTQMLDAINLVIFSRKKPEGIPALTRKQFLEFQDSHELIKFLKEF